MKVLFLSDGNDERVFYSKGDFLGYLKIDEFDDLKTKNFFKRIVVKTSIPDDKYVIFYDTYDFTFSFDKLLNGNGITKKLIQDLQDKKCSIIFFHSDCNGLGEYRYDNPVWKKFSKMIKKYNIDKQNISFIFQETVVDEQKNFIGVDKKHLSKYKKVPNNKTAIMIRNTKKVILSSDSRYKKYLKLKDKSPDLEQELVDELNNVIDWDSCLDFKIIFHNRNIIWTNTWDNHKLNQGNSLKWIYYNSRNYYRNFKYCSLNNNIKDHRVDLYLFLVANNFIKYGVCGFFGGTQAKEQGVDKLDFGKYKRRQTSGIIDFSKLYDKKTVEIANKSIPMSYDLKEHDGISGDYLNPIPLFNSYYNIVTESQVFEYDNMDLQKIFITEKVWKPIITFQPFIVINHPNTLKKLKEWGFKTFDGFIDESYDEIKDYKERRKLIFSEIKRLNNMTIEELDKWYWEMEDILIYNHDHFYNTFVDREYNKIKDLFVEVWENLN